MSCHSVGCGTVSRTQSPTQSATRKFYSRSNDAVIRVYDAAGKLIDTHQHAGEFKRVLSFAKRAETLRHLRLLEPWHSAIAETRKPIARRALPLINFL
jgi:hypothetical protein